MDIKREREAFEIQFRNTKQYISILHFIEMGAAGSHQDIHSVFQRCDFNEDEYAHSSVQSGWLMWQAAKAQAVPEWFDYTKRSPQMDGNYQIFIKGEQITAKWVSRFGFADPIEGDALRQELITHWATQPQSPKVQEPDDD